MRSIATSPWVWYWIGVILVGVLMGFTIARFL